MRPGGADALARALDALGVPIEDVLDQLEATVSVLDTTGAIRWQNAMSVARVGDQLGVNFLELMSPEHKAMADTEFTRLIFNPDASSRREIVVVGPNGKRMRTLSFGTPIQTADDRVVGVVVIGVPLTWDEQAQDGPPLTPRLLETLELLTAGRSTREIAAELGITVETARNYVRRLLKTLGVHSRVEAVALGRELRLVTSVPSGSSAARPH
jgi:DNA-binding CsgD family transcriptional regulator